MLKLREETARRRYHAPGAIGSPAAAAAAASLLGQAAVFPPERAGARQRCVLLSSGRRVASAVACAAGARAGLRAAVRAERRVRLRRRGFGLRGLLGAFRGAGAGRGGVSAACGQLPVSGASAGGQALVRTGGGRGHISASGWDLRSARWRCRRSDFKARPPPCAADLKHPRALRPSGRAAPALCRGGVPAGGASPRAAAVRCAAGRQLCRVSFTLRRRERLCHSCRCGLRAGARPRLHAVAAADGLLLPVGARRTVLRAAEGRAGGFVHGDVSSVRPHLGRRACGLDAGRRDRGSFLLYFAAYPAAGAGGRGAAAGSPAAAAGCRGRSRAHGSEADAEDAGGAALRSPDL